MPKDRSPQLKDANNMDISRRNIGLAVAGASLLAPMALTPAAAQPAEDITVTENGDAPASIFVMENQMGDPDWHPETIKYDANKTQNAGQKAMAQFKPRIKTFADDLLARASACVGKNRAQNIVEINRYLEMMFVPAKIGGNPTPYCAAGVSAMAALTYANLQQIATANMNLLRSNLAEIDHYHFFPSPSVLEIYYVAAGKRRWVSRAKAKVIKPGWLVIFDWKKNGGADHVGIVESVQGNVLNTIEFNTTVVKNGDVRDGGQVARKERALNATVKGFVRTDLVTLL
jgi:hypothetical protein